MKEIQEIFTKPFEMGDKVNSKYYKNGKEGRVDGYAVKSLNNLMYLINGQHSEHKRYLNQLEM